MNSYFYEGRLPGSKNKSKNNDEVGGITVNADEIKKNDIKTVVKNGKKTKFSGVRAGVSAEENGTHGLYAVDPPKPEDEQGWEAFDPDNTTNENVLALYNAIEGEADFFVQGEAGWAKTDSIVQYAHKSGYHVITVYLDKAVATDLGGIPIPVDHEESNLKYQAFALPCWAAEMIVRKDKKYLLFFDEMNQAAPDVLNALMPIILKHEICGVKFDNILVGGAGNLESENEGGITRLNKPLMSRLDIIDWQTHTEDTWADAFNWMHKKYDTILGEDYINKVESLKEYWESPRDVTRRLLKWAEKFKGKKIAPTAYIYKSQVAKTVWDKKKLERSDEDTLKEFAEYMHDWAKADGKLVDENDERESNIQQGVNQEDRTHIKRLLLTGYIDAKDVDDSVEKRGVKTYVICPENALSFAPEDSGITAEEISRIVKELNNTVNKSGKTIGVKYPNKEAALKACKEKKYVYGEFKGDDWYEDGKKVS